MADAAELARLYREQTSPQAPAYARIKDVVLTGIRDGLWAEGDRLPSENQLVESLGVARMTVNRALRELALDGRIVRKIGRGTFVADEKATSALLEVRNIADEIAARGHRHHAEVVMLEREAADGRLARPRAVDVVFHSLIVHFENDDPIQLEDRLVDPAVAPDYLDQDFTAVTPNEYLAGLAPITRGEHVVEAVRPTPQQQSLLRVAADEPCLLVKRRTWSGSSEVSAARLLHPGSRARLEGTFGP